MANRWNVAAILVSAILISTAVGIKSYQGDNRINLVISGIIFVACGLIFTLFQWLFPLSSVSPVSLKLLRFPIFCGILSLVIICVIFIDPMTNTTLQPVSSQTPVAHASPPTRATVTPTSSPTTTPHPTATPLVPSTATNTDWGLLTGDTINVNKQLTCGVGCPELLHVRIETIQIDLANDLMTWNVHFFGPTNSVGNGIADAGFPTFTLESNTTPTTQATLVIGSTGNMQAKFPFTPVPNELYMLTVIASYHTTTDGIESINSTTRSYETITLSFQL